MTRLLREAAQLDLDRIQQARLAWLRELFQVGIWLGPDNVRSCVWIVEQMQLDGDTGLALRSLFSLAQRAWWAEPDADTRALILRTADQLPVTPDDPQLLVILAMAAPTERAATVLDRVRQVRPEQSSDPEVMRLLGLALSVVGAIDESAGYFAAAAAGLRSQGRLGLLAQTLVSHTWSEFLRGDWRTAGTAAEEAGRLARETVQPGVLAVAQLAEAALAAVAGRPELVASTTAEVERMATPLRATPLIAFTELTRGLSALAEGHPADALEHLLRLFDPGSPAHHPFVQQFAIADLADAAAGSDRRDLVRDIFSGLETLAVGTPSPILHASLRYARPLLASDDAAEALFRAGFSADMGRWPFLRARLLHAYGAWLRRQRRTADSRPPLRSARDAFEVLGAHPWAEQVREQLRGAGEASPLPVPDARDLLTAQEFQVAALAAEGLTNREIAEQLFLSHRTVGAHLHRAFPKLGITSRTQLGQAIGQSTQAASG
jgi:DNA-binding CsgD family transcriptional regulator